MVIWCENILCCLSLLEKRNYYFKGFGFILNIDCRGGKIERRRDLKDMGYC